MPIEIIKEAKRIHVVECSLEFQWRNGEPGHGFSFPCDENGRVNTAELQRPGLESLAKCLFGEHDVVFEGIQVLQRSYREPAIGRCHCGREVELANFTNTCECGQDYNSSGQILAPRDCWGEETGEHWSDCI